MENENNPWLEITKKDSLNPIEKSIIQGSRVWEIHEQTFPTGWVLEQERQLRNLLIYGTTHPEIALKQYPVTREEAYQPEDYEEAEEILHVFHNDTMIEFVELFDRLGLDTSASSIIELYQYLEDNDPSVKDLIDYLYENNYWVEN